MPLRFARPPAGVRRALAELPTMLAGPTPNGLAGTDPVEPAQVDVSGPLTVYSVAGGRSSLPTRRAAPRAWQYLVLSGEQVTAVAEVGPDREGYALTKITHARGAGWAAALHLAEGLTAGRRAAEAAVLAPPVPGLELLWVRAAKAADDRLIAVQPVPAPFVAGWPYDRATFDVLLRAAKAGNRKTRARRKTAPPAANP